MNRILSNKEFEKLYDECLSGWPKPTAKMSKVARKLDDLFNEYLEICMQRAFRYAYQLGYEAAINKTEKGGKHERK